MSCAPKSARPATSSVPRLLPLGMIVVLGSLWGLAFSFSKMATNGGVHPIAYTFWQAFAAGIVVLGVCLLRRTRLSFRPDHLRVYLVNGVTGIALPNVILVTAIAHLPAGVMVLTIPFSPLMTYVIAVAVGMERYSVLRVAGVLCGLGGVALIVLPRASLPDVDAAPWFLLALLTPACYAVNGILAVRLRPPDARSLPLAAGMLLAAAIVLAPFMFAPDVLFVPSLPLGEAEIGVFGQIAVSSVAYVMLFEILRLAGPVFMSFTGYIVTLTGIAWGVLLFGERHSPWVWSAGLLIFAGLALVNLRRDAARGVGESVRPAAPR